jgi:hypothetical protein
VDFRQSAGSSEKILTQLRNHRKTGCIQQQHLRIIAVVTMLPQPLGSLPHQTQPDFEAENPHPSDSVELPFAELSPHELITDQFEVYGVSVQGAIAVTPSNPSFIEQTARLALMPLGQQAQMRLLLHQRFTTIGVHLRGYRDFRIDALDHDGHSLTAVIVHRHRQEPQHKAPDETITVDAAKVAQLVISSSTSFVLAKMVVSPQ